MTRKRFQLTQAHLIQDIVHSLPPCRLPWSRVLVPGEELCRLGSHGSEPRQDVTPSVIHLLLPHRPLLALSPQCWTDLHPDARPPPTLGDRAWKLICPTLIYLLIHLFVVCVCVCVCCRCWSHVVHCCCSCCYICSYCVKQPWVAWKGLYKLKMINFTIISIIIISSCSSSKSTQLV